MSSRVISFNKYSYSSCVMLMIILVVSVGVNHRLTSFALNIEKKICGGLLEPHFFAKMNGICPNMFLPYFCFVL